jgi:hypothetical protein
VFKSKNRLQTCISFVDIFLIFHSFEIYLRIIKSTVYSSVVFSNHCDKLILNIFNTPKRNSVP